MTLRRTSHTRGTPMKLLSTTALPVLIALANGCTAPSASSQDETLFEIDEFVTAAAAHQTVLPGSFSSDAAAELAVLSVHANGDRQVQLHRLDGSGWTQTLEARLDAGTLFFDVATIAGRKRLITYRAGGVYWFDPDAATERRLVDVTAPFATAGDHGIPRIEMTRDLNGDGRDDLLLPDLDGFWVSTQGPDGSFATARKLGPAEPHRNAKAYGETRTYGEAGITTENMPWYLGRVHVMDYDRDGRDDLVFWNGEGFEVYRQDRAGAFAADPDPFTIDVPFDFDGAYALGFLFGDASVPSLFLGTGERIERTVLHGFRDLNGDGIADLVALSLSGRSPFRLRGRYEMHFGRPVPGGIAFAPTPDTTAAAPGSSAGLAWGYATQHFLDFDGDGGTDMAMTAVDIGIGGMVRAMAANSISIELALYRQRDGKYPAKPDATRRVRTPFAPFNKKGPLFPTVLVGDVNGDGRQDLLTRERWDELSVFLGTPGPDPLASHAINVSVAMPPDERHTSLVDLDHDGKQDVIIHHPPSAEPGRVIALMAR